ncbi:hypothetical protein HL657_01540 [Methanoculleus sp. YWC-01]|jgi:hypothetical protein|uniref:Uncharacterized protein n=1 Tax=Methanoculleus nereidis TaxID=2735141 RepID=A0ABU3YZ87_9EURY|nr:hypothetical protein [Methanoculleus sp. YWC-01]MCK9299652.1 hypothetical protein [Methanoculleus sp.]MDV4341880.1 hypothetical protein [Methanoculleus sp. YWC-01]PKL55708.1 MAG: hypothetical protein CVV35_08600 [Methanomicrobiales archaeon HGW-Methanomicrobiales-6]
MSGKIVASLPKSPLSPTIPPLVAVVACVIWAGTARTASGIIGPAPPFVLPVFVLVMVTLAVAGAATPLPLISGAVPIRRERQAMLVAVAASVPFVAALLINPGQWERDDALPLLVDSVPAFGWLFDGIMNVLPLTAGTLAYSLLFSAFGVFGFYLECVLVATVIYAVLRLIAASAPGLREERHTEEEG